MAGFHDIIGHEAIIRHLQNAISLKKVSHAYLFDGPEHSGKKMLAEAFAKALLCEQGDVEACGQCKSCKQFANGNQPDMIYVTHEKPKIISVDEIRKQVNGDISIRPYSSNRKIYIIDEAEKMNEQAQNALLKTLEEPPEYAVIMLLTTNAESFLPTIRSRCIAFRLKTVASEQIRRLLMQEYQVPDYRADMCISFAQGNVGRAIELAGSEEFSSMKENLISIAKRLDEMRGYELADEVKALSEYEDRIGECLDLLQMWYRDVLFCKSGMEEDKFVFRDQVYEIRKEADQFSFAGIESAMEAIKTAGRRLKANVNRDLTLEMMLMDIQRQMKSR